MFIIISHTVLGQKQQFTVMTYNIENAFDTIHDEGKNDYEYCPDGERHWTRYRLFKKLRNIMKVIAAADIDRPVDIVALCEVENDTVMDYLLHRTKLNKLGYKYIMTNSADSRGIDVALIYSPFTFHPIETQQIRAYLPEHYTRDILRVSGTISGGDTLDVYAVHLPSKRGGSKAMARSMTITQMLKHNADSIRQSRQHPNIIIMGDYNAEPKSPQLKFLTTDGMLTDTSAKLKPGTYKYQGNWSIIDHILTHTTTLHPQETRILTLPFIVEKDETRGGIKPSRTYLGPVYKGGTSDHLPVFMRFEIN